ncbi:MAG: MbcA/ParS/Xre antitoxin family protein [Psychrosphaera sp.]|nr:MbcA/ParS/Xre antitoxin family protein [Psychrosphaera sp.]
MLSAVETLEQSDPKVVSQTALSVFFNIVKGWQLSAQNEMVLLGEPARGTFYKWRKGEGPVISKDTLERISYVMGIYKALRVLFPNEAQANSWPSKPNRDFANNSAMQFMLLGSVTHLSDVRRYLDAMRR